MLGYDNGQMTMTRALVVVNYSNVLAQNAKDAMVDACARWHADYFEMNERTLRKIDNMHPAAMKTAVFRLLPYDEVFSLGADTLVSEECPSPFEAFPDPAFLYVVRDCSPHGCQDYEWKKLIDQEPHLACPQNHDTYFNSGMMLARRAAHAGMFDQAFEISSTDHGLGWVDQTPLNVAAVLQGVQVRFIDERWNDIRSAGAFIGMRRGGPYIVHFAGCPGREERLKTLPWRC